MRTYLVIIFSYFFVFSLNAAVKTGVSAPAFTLIDSAGASHSLSDFVGKYVVLEWTNHRCPFVVKHYREGHMQALQESMTDKGVVWLQINSGAKGKQGYLEAEQAQRLSEIQGFKSTAYLIDSTGEVGRLYDARTTPHVFLIDPEGLLIYQGAIDSIKSVKVSDVDLAENYLVAAYESHTNGEQIAKSTTKPYGCRVKY
ncbi:MAG: redoxin domain-containing protein [Verrucomicrobiota bacterium]